MNPAIQIIMNQTFSTQRLLLNTLDEKDASFILELTNTPGWLQFIGNRNIYSITDAQTYIKKIQDNPDAKYWKVSLEETQVPIGVITLIKRDYLEDCDIGFAFLPNFAGKGYAFEASKIVLDRVMEHSSNGVICAVTQADNLHSIKLLKKLGLSKASTIMDQGKPLELYTISQDKLAIDQLTQAFFNIFTNLEGQSPNWEHIHHICLPEIIIIKKEQLKQSIYNLASFIEPRKQILRDGTLRNFEEFEIAEETTIIGNMAQRSTTYRKRGQFNGQPFDQLGNKLFQFIKTQQGWRINSIVWEDQST